MNKLIRNYKKICQDDLKYYHQKYQEHQNEKTIYNLATAHFNSKTYKGGRLKYKKAFALYKESLAYKENHMAYEMLGQIYLESEYYEKAGFYYRKAYKLYKDNKVLHNIGICYYYCRQYQKAFRIFKKLACMTDNTYNEEAIEGLMACLIKLKDIETLKVYYEKFDYNHNYDLPLSIECAYLCKDYSLI